MSRCFICIALKALPTILWWGLAIQQLIAQTPPAGVLFLRPGRYVFTEHQKAFDKIKPDGLTIEVWFYLTALPKDGERWILLANPGSYEIAIRKGSVPVGGGARLEHVYVEATVYLLWDGTIARIPHALIDEPVVPPIVPRVLPVHQRLHIALQIGEENLTQITGFLDGSRKQHTTARARTRRSNQPLFIGGAKPLNIEGFLWGQGDSSLEGWIDEVRISNTIRYPTHLLAFKPPRRFRLDAHTVALWHFNEGPMARRYVDVSGNGYTLSAVGPFPVDVQDKLATKWGSLKTK